jgi:K(+)-stimulated pyrophosphate-energized sodium pump
VYFTIGTAFLGVWGALFVGLVAGNVIGFFTEFYTSDSYRPTKSLADQSLTGPATLIIGGLSLGMLSTLIPVVVVVIATLAAFALSGGFTYMDLGLYGIGLSAVGMLSTLGITLATDAYGPVADNAGGIAEMAKLDPEVRHRTDALDSLGNTTAATGKGFAIASAALTALSLIAEYGNKIKEGVTQMFADAGKAQLFERFYSGLISISRDAGQTITGIRLCIDMLDPRILVGVFLGAVLPFVFCSLAMKAVGRAAGDMVQEVRRQFKAKPGILKGKDKPDYATCVAISTQGAQKAMIVPSLLAIIAPVLVGILFGPFTVIALLASSMATGFVLAIMMANSGGAWDNAKKFIERGAHGGKGSVPHKAAVVGDTVGDPFKDTAGPSLNILLKLMSMVSITVCLAVNDSLLKAIGL